MPRPEIAPGREPVVPQIYKGVRTGGRSARIRSAVLEAAVAELTDGGYEGLTLQGVARRAEVAPSTLHRRWGTKSALILDLATELTTGMVPDPHGANLRDDLLKLAHSVTAMLREPTVVMLLRAAFVLPAAQLDELREGFWGSRMQVAQDIVDRAAERGEIEPGQRSGWDIVEPVHSTLWMRLLITGLPVDDGVIERVVDRAIAEAAAGA